MDDPKLRRSLAGCAFWLAVVAGLVAYGRYTEPKCAPGEVLVSSPGFLTSERACILGHH